MTECFPFKGTNSNPHPGLENCKPCEANDQEGMTECEQVECPDGQVVTEGVCVPCPVGQTSIRMSAFLVLLEPLLTNQVQCLYLSNFLSRSQLTNYRPLLVVEKSER